MTRMVGRTAHCSATSASNCSASTAGTSVPRSAVASPRKSRTIVFRRGLADGSRTRSPSRNGSSGSAWPSSSPAPQNTWQPASGASATAARTSADLPMPGSPSMRTEPPRPRATSFISPVSSAISLSRPTSAPAGVTGCMQRTLLPDCIYGTSGIIRTLIRQAILSFAAVVIRTMLCYPCNANCTDTFHRIIQLTFLPIVHAFQSINGRTIDICQIRMRQITLGVWNCRRSAISPHSSDMPCGPPEPCSRLLTSVEAMEESHAQRAKHHYLSHPSTYRGRVNPGQRRGTHSRASIRCSRARHCSGGGAQYLLSRLR